MTTPIDYLSGLCLVITATVLLIGACAVIGLVARALWPEIDRFLEGGK